MKLRPQKQQCNLATDCLLRCIHTVLTRKYSECEISKLNLTDPHTSPNDSKLESELLQHYNCLLTSIDYCIVNEACSNREDFVAILEQSELQAVVVSAGLRGEGKEGVNHAVVADAQDLSLLDPATSRKHEYGFKSVSEIYDSITTTYRTSWFRQYDGTYRPLDKSDVQSMKKSATHVIQYIVLTENKNID